MTKEAFDKIAAGLNEAVRVQRLIQAVYELSDPPFEMTEDEAIHVLARLDAPIP